jgi:hypothetical protein
MIKKPFVLLFILLPFISFAQSYKVYPYMTPKSGEIKVAYWFSATGSDHTYMFFEKEIDRQGLMAHSLEIGYALGDKWTTALYIDFEQPPGNSPKRVNSRALMFYGRFWEKDEHFINLGLYAAYIVPRNGYKTAEKIELKGILEKDFGSHTFLLNPTFTKKISGPDVTEGTEFEIAGSWYFNQNSAIRPGIEFYSNWGELQHINPKMKTITYLFPALNIIIGKGRRIDWNTGFGFGMTDHADNFVFKSILSFRFF